VKIKRLRSDRGGEYTSGEFDRYLKGQGTERRLTTHDTPQHNGVAESLNRRLLERVRAVLHHSGLPKHLWGEATLFATWLKNRTSTRVLGNATPFERLYKQKPNLAGVPEWGQRVWIHTDAGSKLDGRAVEGHWVGYDKDSTHAHRIYWPSKNSISVERNIRFAPTSVTIHTPPEVLGRPTTAGPAPPPPPLPPALPPTPASTQPQLRDVALPPSDAEDEGEEETKDDEDVEEQLDPALPGQYESPAAPTSKGKTASKLRKSGGNPSYTQPTRASTRKGKPSEYHRRLEAGEGTVDGLEHGSNAEGAPATGRPKKSRAAAAVTDDLADFGADCAFAAAAIGDTQGDPRTVSEARSRADWPLWQQAMDREMKTLEGAGTWETVPRPPGRNIVGSKWVYRVKRTADGAIDKYKARLVARGFTQVYGTDYFETYSPVAKMTSFRTILALAARHDWDVDSFDFDGAYLNGELGENEVIYMQNPPGYDSGEGSVKYLKKSLYGLKQAGRKWYDTLKRSLADLGFRVSDADPGVFHTRVGEHPIIIAVHVDDCAITSSSGELLQDYKRKIDAQHSITDLGPIHWLLGIKITRDRSVRTLSLAQGSYIDTIIKRFNLGDAKPIPFPMSPGISFSTKDAPADKTEAMRMAKTPYREAIGSLMYACVATRPDISFAVSTLSQFLENPGEAHWEAAKRVFRYLAGTKGHTLTYGGERHELTGYTDADGASQDHRRAISGHAFLIDGGVISWSSRKQELVTLSTAEAEYVAATHAAKEGIWLRRLIGELFGTFSEPTIMHCDNQAALTLATTDNFHARTKHIDIRYHFIRHTVNSGAIKLVYCPTDDMVADILTKALPAWKVKGHSAALGLRGSGEIRAGRAMAE
jgi:Reverse transcriptase (RNA-dependent DNA polymerase)